MIPVSPERLSKIAEVMAMIQQDTEAEAMALDGQPFDGKTVAVQFGNLLAEVNSIAKAVQVIAEHVAERPA